MMRFHSNDLFHEEGPRPERPPNRPPTVALANEQPATARGAGPPQYLATTAKMQVCPVTRYVASGHRPPVCGLSLTPLQIVIMRSIRSLRGPAPTTRRHPPSVDLDRRKAVPPEGRDARFSASQAHPG